MGRRIAIIQGHPDPSGKRFGHALASAYAMGASEGGHAVTDIRVAGLDFPLLHTKDEFEHGSPPEVIRTAQAVIRDAEHLVLVYPLWLGSMPALLKAFLEQVFRPGFAMEQSAAGVGWDRRMTGKSARIVVTMGMPAFVYRWYFRAHSVKSLERNVLRFCGIAPIKECLIGNIEAQDPSGREKWLARIRGFGRQGR